MMEQIRGNRRAHRRYQIALEVRWNLLRRNEVLDSGSGRTVDLSSGGILLETGRELPLGLTVQLSVSWPVLLQSSTRIQLAVKGRVVRSDGVLVAIETVQHEFRTVGVSPSPHRGEWPMPARVPFSYRAVG
jgi:PilZ domain